MVRFPVLFGALVLALVLAACGTGGSGAPAVPSPAAAGESGSSPASTSGATPGAASAASAGAALQLAGLQLVAADLPSGWRDSNGADGDYRTTVCGVDLEPVAASAARSLRFSQGPVGPFLAQYLRGYDDDQGRQVADRLAAALRGCTGYEVTDTAAGRRVTFTVAPLSVPGLAAGDVAWRQTSTGVAHPVTADYVLAVRGRTAVVLASYTVTGAPDPVVLATAYRALQAKP